MTDQTHSIRLFIATPLKENDRVFLTPRQSHYLLNVMRLNIGQNFLVFNGEDGEFLAQISEIQKRIVHLTIKNQTHPQPPEHTLNLLFAPLKGERLGFLIEKATELGVSDFIPIFTKHTVPSYINLERIEARAIEAVEQCERLTIPNVHESMNLEEILEKWSSAEPLFFCEERSSAPLLAETLQKDKRGCSFLIGPEGGFSKEEKELLRSKSFVKPVSLGAQILRAETAAIMSLCLFMAFSQKGT
ncbi:MAG: 16S rRNA (uracil(1498)-N(3))-methyltransferase [Proteobacteria bacterium]|nr:16S rRNA (uracil(1498)-N(3))-methyltransferase [Pseudomonadota bacterium]